MSDPFLDGGLFMVAVYDAYEGKRDMAREPKVQWVVKGRDSADQLLQFVTAFLDSRASEYGELFAAKVWLPSWVSPSATMLGQAREELDRLLEEIK